MGRRCLVMSTICLTLGIGHKPSSMQVEVYFQQSYSLWSRRQGMRGYQHTPLEASWVSLPAQPPFVGSTFPVLIVLQTRIRSAVCVPFRRGGIDSNLWKDFRGSTNAELIIFAMACYERPSVLSIWYEWIIHQRQINMSHMILNNFSELFWKDFNWESYILILTIVVQVFGASLSRNICNLAAVLLMRCFILCIPFKAVVTSNQLFQTF